MIEFDDITKLGPAPVRDEKKTSLKWSLAIDDTQCAESPAATGHVSSERIMTVQWMNVVFYF